MLLACKEEAPPAKEAGPVDTADTGDTAVKPPDVELGDPYMAEIGRASWRERV